MAGPEKIPRVVVAGGGVAAIEALLTFNEAAAGRVRLTLLAAEPTFNYLPLAVTEAFSGGHAYRLELEEIAESLGAELEVGALTAVDSGARRLTTAEGESLDYDALLVAVGARRRGTLPGALTFAGAKASADLRGLLKQAAEGQIERLIYAAPPGVNWTLPAYELALITAGHFEQGDVAAKVAVVSHEPRPLAVFGGKASEAIAAQLRMREVEYLRAEALRVEPGRLVLDGGGEIEASAVVALPRLFAQEIEGLPSDAQGFLPVDDYCRVPSIGPVYGAGDATSSPLKQGGVAAQQAETAALSILADLGLGPRPEPFQPLLRGLMLVGPPSRYRRLDPAALAGPSRAKIAGRHLASFLGRRGIPISAPPNMVTLEVQAEASAGQAEMPAGPAGSDPD